jgi:hypothetical protein
MRMPDNLTVMTNLSNLLPPAVIAATSIFVIKEALELSRKSRARKRKIRAYKKILAEELERNYWTWKSLRSSIVRVSQDRADAEEFSHRIISVPSGAKRIEGYYADGTLSSGANLPEVSRSSFERVLLGIAEEDEALYLMASSAYDEVSEMSHIRESLINFIGDQNGVFLDGFIEYAIETLDRAIEPIKSLYKLCTGNELERHKVR